MVHIIENINQLACDLGALRARLTDPSIKGSEVENKVAPIAHRIMSILANNNAAEVSSLAGMHLKAQMIGIRKAFEKGQKSHGLIASIVHSFCSLFGLGIYGKMDHLIKVIDKVLPKSLQQEPRLGCQKSA